MDEETKEQYNSDNLLEKAVKYTGILAGILWIEVIGMAVLAILALFVLAIKYI